MTKRLSTFIVTLCWLCLRLSGIAVAADVVALKSLDIRPYKEAVEGFRETCGCTVIEMTLPDDGRSDVIRRVIDRNPSAVLAVGIDSLEYLQTIRNIPVLYTMVPSAQGIPAGAMNISGVNTQISSERNLAAIADVIPQAGRIGIIYDPRNSERVVQDAAAAAQARGMQVVLKKVGKATEVPASLEGLRDRVDVLWMIPDATVINAETVKQILIFSFQNRVPVFTFSKKFVEMGAVAALNVVPYDMGAQAGDLTARLLRERQTAPIRTSARKTSLVINSKVARKLGLKMKDDLSRRADDVGQ